MIIEREHEEANFLIVANDTARDRRLTLRARGLLIAILSMPPGASVRLEDFENDRERRDALRTAFRELMDVGYAHRDHVRDARGRLSTRVRVRSRPADPSSVAPELRAVVGGQAVSDRPTRRADRDTKRQVTPRTVQPSPVPNLTDDPPNVAGSPGTAEPAPAEPTPDRPAASTKDEPQKDASERVPPSTPVGTSSLPTSPAPKGAGPQKRQANQEHRPKATDLVRAWWESLEQKPIGGTRAYYATIAIVAGALAAGHAPEKITAALTVCEPPVTSARLELALRGRLTQIRAATASAEPPAWKTSGLPADAGGSLNGYDPLFTTSTENPYA